MNAAHPVRPCIAALLAALGLGVACSDGNLDVFAKPTATGGAPSVSMGGASGDSAGSTSSGTSGGDSSAGTRSSGGGSNSAGSSAAGEGSESAGGAAAEPSNTLAIDDFEDGNTQALCSDGHWYVSNDGTGSQSFGLEAAEERTSGSHVMRSRGQDFSDWGAALGVDLEGSSPALDVSTYDELWFSIRAEPGFEGSLNVSLLYLDDTHFLQRIELTDDWQDLRLPLSSFLGTDGTPLDARRVADLQFFVLAGQAFDFSIDDLAFVRAPE